MNATILGIVGVLVLIGMIFLGTNIGFAMAAVGFVGFALFTDIPTAFSLFRTVPFTNAASYSLSVIPLFILMGQFAHHSGISHGLFDACERFLGRTKGGLCAAAVATSAGFSAICGSAPATAATMATLALPAMRRRSYDDSLSTGCIAAGGTPGILIPPSTPFIVYGGIFSGFFTANEAAGVGAFVAMLFMAPKKKLTFKNVYRALYESVKITAMIYIIFIGAYIFGYFLTITMIPITMANFVASLNVPPLVVMLIILAIYVVLGCIMDAMAMVLLTVPIFLPIIEMLQLDPVWFGVVIVLVMQIGMMTPPVGMNVYVLAGIARDVPMHKIFKGVVPFVIAAVIVVVIVLLVPELSLWLPNLIFNK